METAWIVFWYLAMTLTVLLAGWLAMSVTLYLTVKNDIENKKIELQIRRYDDERSDRLRFTKMSVTPMKDN